MEHINNFQTINFLLYSLIKRNNL